MALSNAECYRVKPLRLRVSCSESNAFERQECRAATRSWFMTTDKRRMHALTAQGGEAIALLLGLLLWPPVWFLPAP